MNNNPSTRQTIVQLLSNMQDGKEIRSYLSRFAAVDQTRFAVIKIGGQILRDNLEDTASALAFLHTVGLTPIVIHGGGPQLDAELARRGIETPKVEGLRVTSPEAMDVARDVFIGENIRLVEAVRRQGVEAEGHVAGVIEADFLDRDTYGLVGTPREVRQGLLQSTVNSGAIPILTCMGLAPGGQLVNINGDSATRAVVEALQPIKVVFLTGVGALLNEEGKPISSINLATDYDGLIGADWVAGGMRVKLEEINRLLSSLPLSSSVSITTPAALIQELFTHGGAGTLVRRGEGINIRESKSELDKDRTQHLIELSFGRRLRKSWWENLDLHEAHISDSYRAGAILSRLDEFVYLDKFAVVEGARGEGLSRTVWRGMERNCPKFFWRSRTKNGFNAFYHDKASGSLNAGEWTVFWVGEKDFSTIGRAVELVSGLPDSFEA